MNNADEKVPEVHQDDIPVKTLPNGQKPVEDKRPHEHEGQDEKPEVDKDSSAEPSQGTVPPVDMLTQPGAIAVHGINGQVSLASIGTSAANSVENADAHVTNLDLVEELERPVEAYKVTDEEDRNKIPVARASLDNRKRYILIALLIAITLVAIGTAVSVTQGRKSSDSEPASPLGSLDATVFQVETAFENYQYDIKRYKQIDENGEILYTTMGAVSLLDCQPIACMASDEHCIVGENFAVGCCAGPDCPLDKKCGERCVVGVHCRQKRGDCNSIGCYECDKGEDGQDLFYFTQHTVSIDCLDVGTKTSADGIEYNWAVFCGPQESGGATEENRDPGEYQCSATRKSVNGYHPSIDDIEYNWYPCQFFQLAWCGCGPLDMYDFGLGMPTKPCQTHEDCPLLCGDVPAEANKACYAFGGVDWWEKNNPWGADLLYMEDLPHNNEFLEIKFHG